MITQRSAATHQILPIVGVAVVAFVATQPVQWTSDHGVFSLTIAALVACLFPASTKRRRGSAVALGLVAAAPFAIIVASSIGWSILPLESLSATGAVLAVILAALAIGRKHEVRVAVIGIWLGLYAGLIASLGVALLMPAVGLVGEVYNFGALRGIYEHRNQLGYVATLTIALQVSLAFAERRWRGAMGFVLALPVAICLIGSASSTALALSIAAIVTGTGIGVIRRLPPRGRVVPAVALAACGAGGVVAVFLLFDTVTAALGRDATLTGRTTIWPWVIEIVRMRPWWGWGWGAVWADQSEPQRWISDNLVWRVYHAHNSYLDVLVQVGIFGLLAFGWLCLRAIGRCWSVMRLFRDSERSYLWASIILILLMLVYSIVETRVSQPLGILVLTIAAAQTGQCRTVNAHRARDRRFGEVIRT